MIMTVVVIRIRYSSALPSMKRVTEPSSPSSPPSPPSSPSSPSSSPSQSKGIVQHCPPWRGCLSTEQTSSQCFWGALRFLSINIIMVDICNSIIVFNTQSWLSVGSLLSRLSSWILAPGGSAQGICICVFVLHPWHIKCCIFFQCLTTVEKWALLPIEVRPSRFNFHFLSVWGTDCQTK